MRPRIPLAYAGLLIVAFVAVIGFAAFSPSSKSPEPAVLDQPEAAAPVTIASARVASAVLALRVSDAESRTATTASSTTTEGTVAAAPPVDNTSTSAPPTSEETTTTAETTTTTEATTTTTRATTTTEAGDTTPPPITVTSPKDGSTVSESLVTFTGTTERGARVASGPYAASVDSDGNWSIKLVLTEGPNGAVFTATDAAGNSNTERIVVHYEPVTTTTSGSVTTTTSATTTTAGTTWSPLWPADAGGARDVEYWRDLVAKHWPAQRVDCALGIIKRESKGDPRAYNSGSWAEGLMQHLRKYWYGRAKGAGFIDGDGLVATPYNGEANIAAGAYLAAGSEANGYKWWRPWKTSAGTYPDSAKYGSCQSDDPS